jgi:hypothetical protein
MSRFALATVIALVGCSGCSKSRQEAGTTAGGPASGSQIAVPGGDTAATTSLDKGEIPREFRLAPDEGRVAIEPPANAVAGAEVVAKIVLTPTDKYKVNEEYPTKITLESTSGVTLAKAVLRAGGHEKDKGDADVFNDKQLAFVVKLTPAQNGTYTVNGRFKFAVCDRAGNQCLAKTEPIAIQVAAK